MEDEEMNLDEVFAVGNVEKSFTIDLLVVNVRERSIEEGYALFEGENVFTGKRVYFDDYAKVAGLVRRIDSEQVYCALVPRSGPAV